MLTCGLCGTKGQTVEPKMDEFRGRLLSEGEAEAGWLTLPDGMVATRVIPKPSGAVRAPRCL